MADQLPVNRETNDPELHHADLAWYYRCADSEAGHRSCMGTQIATLQGICGATAARESNHYGERQTSQSLESVSFAKSRRVWARLQRCAESHRVVLQCWYEPRQWYPKGFEKCYTALEGYARNAHRAYRGAG